MMCKKLTLCAFLCLFSIQLVFTQIVLEAPNNSLESNYKWFNVADHNLKVLGTDFYIEVEEPGVYFATYDGINCGKNTSNYFVLTFCDELNSRVTLDLSLTDLGLGELNWHPFDLGNNLNPTVWASTIPITYTATWVRKTSARKLPEITVMCIPNSLDIEGKDDIAPDHIAPVIYNVLTPNGDSYNDYLKIESIQNYPQNNLKIVNRWGALVFKAKGYNNTSILFNGYANTGSVLVKNKKLPTGTYFYRLQYKDKSTNVFKTVSGYLYIKH